MFVPQILLKVIEQDPCDLVNLIGHRQSLPECLDHFALPVAQCRYSRSSASSREAGMTPMVILWYLRRFEEVIPSSGNARAGHFLDKDALETCQLIRWKT